MTAEDKCQVLKDVIALTREHHTVYMQERIYAIKLDDGVFLTEAKSEMDAREKLARLIRQQTDDYHRLNIEIYAHDMGISLEQAEKELRVPSAQPERKKGEWIPHEDEDGEHYGDGCSECGEWYVMPYGKTNFCPNCGADMRGEQDE